MRPLPFFFCHPPRAFDLDYEFARRSASSIGTDIFIRVIRTLYKYLIYNTHRDAPIYFSHSLPRQLHIYYFALTYVCVYTYIYLTLLFKFLLLLSLSLDIKRKRALIFKHRRIPVSHRETRCNERGGREKERTRGRRRSLGRRRATRLLDRIMRTNANSRSLRCGQAFICHALAYRRVQPRTVWNLTYKRFAVSASCLTHDPSSSSATPAPDHLSRPLIPYSLAAPLASNFRAT